MDKTLVAYFSRAGQNYVAGSIEELEEGNTAVLAKAIAEATGADLFEIRTVEPYPADYYACTDVAKRELAEGARPALAELPEDLGGYDTIVLGYPNWWGTAPMAVRSFLDALDLTGTTIAPLCTNEGSGMGSSERDLKAAYPAANVVPGLAVTGHRAASSIERAVAWAQQYI